MSNKLHPDAHLRNWIGPLYPEGTDVLSKAWSDKGFGSLRNLCRMMPKFVRREERDSTADGYEWYAGLVFRADSGGYIKVELPWNQDNRREHGTACDRAPAVYTRGRVSTEDAEKLIAAFAAAIHKTR